jgi:hypothetical protein
MDVALSLATSGESIQEALAGQLFDSVISTDGYSSIAFSIRRIDSKGEHSTHWGLQEGFNKKQAGRLACLSSCLPLPNALNNIPVDKFSDPHFTCGAGDPYLPILLFSRYRVV